MGATTRDAAGPAAADLAAYADAVRGLLARGGYERSGDPREAKRFRIAHVEAFLDAEGRPDRRRTIHVAGSKGKGSTAAMAESVLRAAGARTLLLTSPTSTRRASACASAASRSATPPSPGSRAACWTTGAPRAGPTSSC